MSTIAYILHNIYLLSMQMKQFFYCLFIYLFIIILILSLNLATFENAALREEAKHCPEHVPEVFHFDEKLALIAMRFVEPPHIIMRKALIAQQLLPNVAEHLSSFLANTLFATSYLNLEGGEFRVAVSRWSRNNAMCALTEKVIFTDPYMDASANRWTPQLDHYVKSIRADANLKLAAEALKIKFLSSSEALLHGDLHTGSVMTTETSTFVIDPEFAFYGKRERERERNKLPMSYVICHINIIEI